MERKLRDLPVKFMRVFADNEEEFHLLLRGLQTFKHINFAIEEEEVQPTLQPPPAVTYQQPQQQYQPPPPPPSQPQQQQNQQYHQPQQQYQQPSQQQTKTGSKRKLSSPKSNTSLPPPDVSLPSTSKGEVDEYGPSTRKKKLTIEQPSTTTATFITPDLTIELDGDESQFFTNL